MFRARTFVAAVLAAGALAVMAGPAHASVPAANAKFCKAASNIGDNTSGQPSQKQAAAAVKDFKDAAKYAPPKVKRAIQDISKYLQGVVDAGDDPTDLAKVYTGSSFKKYTKAIGTYVGYVTQCTTSG